MVVSIDRYASEAGVDVLRRGGNAIDAAVAVAFVLAVTAPHAGNLGGGGFLLYRVDAAEHHALDFREVAPAALRAEHFLDPAGRPVQDASLRGGLAVGVPGSVAGLAEAHARWGRRPWRELLRPAIRLARDGFTVGEWLASAFAREHDKLTADPEARRIFTREGAPLRTGDALVQPDLAAALRRIARRGPGGFQEGPLAAALVATVRAHGGVMTEEDLARYRPQLRAPLRGSYRGYPVVAFPPPSSGGVAILQALGMLEGHDLRAAGAGSSLAVHLVAEAERRAFADRSRWLGDPAFADVPVAALLDRRYLAERAATIDPERATPSERTLPGSPRRDDPGGETLHFAVADSGGRVVALTTTLNQWFGTGLVARGTGILLNNELDDFALAPGVPNVYGLLGGAANAVEPGKRPLSSMSPLVVEFPDPGPRPALVLGSPGGSTIITAVLGVLLNVLDHEMPLAEAVAWPRVHHQGHPDVLRHEVRALSPDTLRALAARGHALAQSPLPIGNVNAIGSDGSGRWLGVADPRRQGVAAGY